MMESRGIFCTLYAILFVDSPLFGHPPQENGCALRAAAVYPPLLLALRQIWNDASTHK